MRKVYKTSRLDDSNCPEIDLQCFVIVLVFFLQCAHLHLISLFLVSFLSLFLSLTRSALSIYCNCFRCCCVFFSFWVISFVKMKVSLATWNDCMLCSDDTKQHQSPRVNEEKVPHRKRKTI